MKNGQSAQELKFEGISVQDKENPLTTSIIETHRQHDDLRNELNYLAEYRHPNVIALYGWSLDGPDPCLIYDYMENGSLQDRLQCLVSISVINSVNAIESTRSRSCLK